VSDARSARATWVLAGAAVLVVALVATITVVVVTNSGGGGSGAARVTGALGFGERALGEPAPVFTVPELSGDGEVRLADFRGRPVVVNFWRSDCTPCRDEFPVLARAAARGDAVVVGISTDAIPEDARRFAREERAEWPLALDEDLTVAKAFGLSVSLPQTFFVRADGSVAYRIYGRLDEKLVREGLRATAESA
jgi:cytochrome c biogenesis protein CcmG/thiol:disulfide interchange protein DsbE